MLKLFIKPEQSLMKNADGGIFSFYPILFSRKGKMYKFSEYSFPGIKRIKLVIDFSFILWMLSINKQLEKGIVRAIGLYHRKKNLSFDCYAFTNLVSQVEPHDVSLMGKFWEMKPKRFFSKVGDVIFLINKENYYFYHSAIYIGFGLYISICGGAGDLVVSCLNDMRLDFDEATEVVVARLIKRKVR